MELLEEALARREALRRVLKAALERMGREEAEARATKMMEQLEGRTVAEAMLIMCFFMAAAMKTISSCAGVDRLWAFKDMCALLAMAYEALEAEDEGEGGGEATYIW